MARVSYDVEEEDAAQIHVSGRSCPSVSYIVRHRRVVVWRVRAVLLFYFFLSRRRNSARVDHAYSESYAPVPIRCITLARC